MRHEAGAVHRVAALRAVAAAAIALVTAGAAVAPRPEPAAYDVVIRNGRVLDGAGNPWVAVDVAIKDGRFAKIGRVEGRGRQEIDAAGHYVSPGWIDMMDQSGAALLDNGLAENKVRMGVTTAIGGEGGTPVPSAEIGAYFATLERQGIAINFGTYYGATQARQEVMGNVAGTPAPEQMARMKAHVAQAMEAGAFGITTALIYPPSSFQTTDELIELAKVASEYGGIYASHIRDEGKALLEAINEAIEIGDKGGVAVEMFHLKAAYAPGWGTLMPQAGALIEAARSRGVDIAADMYPYPAGGTGLAITVPNHLFRDGFEEGPEKLKDPEIRTALKQEVAAGSQPDWSNLVEAAGGWEGIRLANAHHPDYDRYRLQSIAGIARQLGKDPEDVAWDIVLAARPKRAMALFFMMDEADIETALRFPWTSIGSDAAAALAPGEPDVLGLPHPRSYGTFPRVIAAYVRERQVLSLAEAVRKMTSWPAARMGLFDRGAVREGLWADVVVFDYERIQDRATWEQATAYPDGIGYVLVNGQVVVAQGRHTGATPGQVLRGPGHR